MCILMINMWTSLAIITDRVFRSTFPMALLTVLGTTSPSSVKAWCFFSPTSSRTLLLIQAHLRNTSHHVRFILEVIVWTKWKLYFGFALCWLRLSLSQHTCWCKLNLPKFTRCTNQYKCGTLYYYYSFLQQKEITFKESCRFFKKKKSSNLCIHYLGLKYDWLLVSKWFVTKRLISCKSLRYLKWMVLRIEIGKIQNSL